MTDIIFSGEKHKVYAHITSDRPVVISFDPWLGSFLPEAIPFGFNFLKNAGRNIISIQSFQNDWYQNEEFAHLLELIDKTAGNRLRIGYGSSMGGYAALNFSTPLKIAHAVIFSPQFSIDANKVPWESRWAHEKQKITFTNDNVEASSPVGGYVFYDPYELQDKQHCELIAKQHYLMQIKIPEPAPV